MPSPTCCYWLDSQFDNQSEWEFKTYPIREGKVFIQKGKGIYGLTSLYISSPIVYAQCRIV